MGTRSTVKFYSEYEPNAAPLVCIYQQFDGYISGVGHELANFLKDKTVINGIGAGQEDMSKFANGMGCLAAQFIAAHKTEIGGLYISEPNDEQEYNYEVRLINGKLRIKVDRFEGSPEDLLEYTESNKDADY